MRTELLTIDASSLGCEYSYATECSSIDVGSGGEPLLDVYSVVSVSENGGMAHMVDVDPVCPDKACRANFSVAR